MYRDSTDEKFRGEGIGGLLGKVKAKLNKEYKNIYAIQEKENLFSEFKNWSKEGENPQIRKMGFLYMAHNMDEKDVVNLRKLFIKIDTNKNGQITAEELEDYFSNNKESLQN
jgi:hypothetical protein